MKPSIHAKLNVLIARSEEVGALLTDPKVINDQNLFRDYSKEYSQLEPAVTTFRKYKTAQTELLEVEKMVEEESDEELRELAEQELQQVKERIEKLENELVIILLPTDPHDNNNVYLEVRAGTGGDEAAIFAGDLYRMYTRYAENQGWKVELISFNDGEHGGYKEIIARLIGNGVYSRFKFESGVHRVQRVPATEAQGRIHTSTCTIAILPEVEEIESIDISPSDLRIDTYRASGAGGQHVQKTDSAVRITHLPTGTVVECQDERSQHKNKAKAMALLRARILDSQRSKQRQQQADQRRSLVGTGDRSERIRTYNFPQGRLTDHRINLTLYQLPKIMEGDLDPLFDALIQENNADLMAHLGD